jgi:AcrR family transcriptional regulator
MDAEQSAPPLSLRAEQKRLTRERLIAAARSVFQAHGFRAATVDEIAARVGASRATFYLHFANKQDVLYAIAEEDGRAAPEYFGRLDAALAGGSREALRAWMEQAHPWLETIHALVPVWDEAALVDPQVPLKGSKMLNNIAGWLPKYLAAWPAERRREARLRLILLVFQLDHFGRWSSFPGWDVDRDLGVEVLTDVWWHTLRPPGAAGPQARRGAGATPSRKHPPPGLPKEPLGSAAWPHI